ncbi:small monomeric GTPase [Entamoeba marina]
MSLYKVVMLGTGSVGKSAITLQHVSGYFAFDYNPTVEDFYRTSMEVDGEVCQVEILDTAGQEEFDALKDTYIRSGDGFALVFSITSLNTFLEANEVRERIYRVLEKEPEEDHIPITLVGNKVDLEHERAVEKNQAEELAKEWGIPYLETSAKKKININGLYEGLIRDIRDTRKAELLKNSEDVLKVQPKIKKSKKHLGAKKLKKCSIF